MKVLCQILGIKGGNARHLCPYCLYNKVSGEPGIKRTGSHFDEMYTKFKELYKCDSQLAKECGGVYRPRIFSSFETPLRSFPIAAVHVILGLREKLLDRRPMKLLGKEEYTRFEESASNLLHKVFGKILLEGWQDCIHEFRNSYGEMQQKVVQFLIKSGDCEVDIDAFTIYEIHF